MTTTRKLTAAVEDYFEDLLRVRASGGATGELSFYPSLANLLNAIGGIVSPKIFCVSGMAQQGAGHPDFGLYVTTQLQKGKPRQGQPPEGGVVEVKPADEDAWVTADSAQVTKYWNRYRLVLVTNMRDFVLVGADAAGKPVKLETFRLSESAEEFESSLQRPREFAGRVGAGLGEYLCRALSHRATLVEPRDVAWLLASYARDGLSRVENSGNTSSLAALRSALEEALGVQFEGERGAAFFRSTLVQTLFYGVFSAWVLWARQTPRPTGVFNWHEAVWHLRAPVIRALFQQLSDPGQLEPLGLVETLDWTAAALDRVDRSAFFARFSDGEAVPYFYEPFLAAFDPQLRKQLGVWYTPGEVVRYMVARVDRALKDDLGIVDGLAADNVYILDPCCGTGAFLAETLRRIAANLESKGLGALAGAQVRQAAADRVFGFEIMPAPFVVAHLQVGLVMQALDVPLPMNGTDRAGIFLTNALTGWESTAQKPLPFPDLEEERKRAARVKQATPILVILGNPPYNGFAGMAMDEERELSAAYRATKRVRRPEGQGLNDLYVRFFRMAERRITEKSGQGVVCFISNYSWLDGLSFTGMRERYLEAFDIIRVDCLNGDKYKTGKTTPDGHPDPSIFSTAEDPVGIQVGTAITTLVRTPDHSPTDTVSFRHLWGTTKGELLTATAAEAPDSIYDDLEPDLDLGLPFTQVTVSDDWQDWPSLPDLVPVSFPGVKTSRDSLLVDIDLTRLKTRITDHFNTEGVTRTGPDEAGFVRYDYRPFDTRWLYWEADSGLLDRPRPDYKAHTFDGNLWLEARQREAQEDFTRGTLCRHLADNFGNGLSTYFPAWLRDEGLAFDGSDERPRPNLSDAAHRYLEGLGFGVEDLFHYILAVLHDPTYRRANAGALRMQWPRIPLPGWPISDNTAAVADKLTASVARGRKLAALLDTESPVVGVTSGTLRTEIASIAVPATTDGQPMAGDDFAVTAGWGHFGSHEAVMPGKGRIAERPYTAQESAALGDVGGAVGAATFDVYLNDGTYWSNVPAAVWNYRLGGHQVLKKWLSYRERKVLGRPLSPQEVQHFTDTARRIAAVLVEVTGPPAVTAHGDR